MNTMMMSVEIDAREVPLVPKQRGKVKARSPPIVSKLCRETGLFVSLFCVELGDSRGERETEVQEGHGG